MGINIDNIVSTGFVTTQRRIKRYDIKWGRPVNALTYKRLSLSHVPAYYWKFEDSTVDNIGFLQTDYGLTATGSGVSFVGSSIDPTDSMVSLTGSGYLTHTGNRADTEMTNGYTVTAWFNINDNVSTDKVIISKSPNRTSSLTNYVLGLQLSSGVTVPFAQFKNGVKLVGSGIDATVSINDNHLLALTVESVGSGNYTAKLYLDGIEVATGTGAQYAPVTSDNSSILIGVANGSSGIDTATQFYGSIDEVFVAFRTLAPKSIRDLFIVGFRSTYIEPDEDFDNDVIGTESVAKNYSKLVRDLNPYHYWSLDSTTLAGSDWLLTDTGYGATLSNLKCNGDIANATTYDSLISTRNGNSLKSKKFWGDSNYAESSNNLAMGSPGAYTPLTVAFWLKLTGRSSEADGIMGFNFTGGYGDKGGFYVYTIDRNIVFVFNDSSIGQNSLARVTVDLGTTRLNTNQTYFICCTMSDTGYVTVYVNGQKVSGSQSTSPRGYCIPPTDSKFRLGKPNGLQDPPTFYLDEVMLLTNTITQAQAVDIYNTGIYGAIYKTTMFGGDPESSGSPYVLNSNEYTELYNEEDITGYVEDYTIDTDIKQIITTSSMIVKESWGQLNLQNKLRANTYLTIEERYSNDDIGEDTGWQMKGHFLVEGPMGSEILNSGERVQRISLRSLLKVLNFDICHTELSPDKLFVPKRKFDVVTTYTDYTKYQLSRDTVSGTVLTNWAESPSLKLWATDFQNLGDAVDGGISSATDTIRIKGSNGGVRVLGGEGSVVIDNDYLSDAITSNGLSNPSSIYAELYRYATVYDVEKDVTITNIYFNTDKWYVAFDISTTSSRNDKTLFVKSGTAKGKIFRVQDFNGSFHLVDTNGLSVFPKQEGLSVGDKVQLGDFNSVEDAIRKVLIKNGFQENDPSLPFYFELDPCPVELSPSVPPTRYNIEDRTRWLNVTEELLTYAPPDYRLYVDEDGVTRGKLLGFTVMVRPSHTVLSSIDIGEDRTDYGVTTRLIVQGEGGQSVNVALHKDFGGTASCRAYQLDRYANNYTDLNGRTLTQSQADALVKQLFDGNPKTPTPPGTGWDYGKPSINRHYGVLFNRYGLPDSVKRWDFEDLDICAIDVGKTSNGTQLTIDTVEITWFDHFIEGSRIKQSMLVYYMTEEDYEREAGRAAPNVPNTSDTSYLPNANARSWKLLVDEFNLDEGDTTVNYDSFVNGKPVKARFFKFRVGQCQHRLRMASGQHKDQVVSRVGVSEIKLYNSMTIYASAELGVTAPFSTADYKDLATRLRRRTDYIDKLYFLDTYDKAKDYAITQLQERYVDFTPLTTSAYAPTVSAGEVITLKHPETGVTRNYLVIAKTHMADGNAKLQLMNYDLVI